MKRLILPFFVLVEVYSNQNWPTEETENGHSLQVSDDYNFVKPRQKLKSMVVLRVLEIVWHLS